MLKIAKKFGVTMEALLAANPKIKNPNKIGVGDPINDPGARAPDAGRRHRAERRVTAGPGRGAIGALAAVSARTASG